LKKDKSIEKNSLGPLGMEILMNYMIDIARHGGALINNNMIVVEDSIEFTEFVKKIAKQFAEGPLSRRNDYYAVIDDFAERQLINRFGIKTKGNRE
jgi:hypothetical protein